MSAFTIPLQDLHLDIIGKAQRALGHSDEGLLAAAGISAAERDQLQSGDPAAPALAKIAPVIGRGRVPWRSVTLSR